MPRLDFYVDSKLFLKIKLEEGRVMLGRGSDCQVQLPRDRVSRQHAVIQSRGEGYDIENLSPNGTRLNAAFIDGATALVSGDRLYIADYVIIYQPDDAPSTDIENERTVLHGE